MIRTVIGIASLAIGLPLTAAASEGPTADMLPPTYIAYQLLGQGHDLRGLDLEKGIYRARIHTNQDRLVTLGVDPRNGELLPHAFLSEEAPVDRSPAPAFDAGAAMQAVALDGHWDVRELKLREGFWKVEACDDAGVTAEFRIDAKSGQVLAIDHQLAERR